MLPRLSAQEEATRLLVLRSQLEHAAESPERLCAIIRAPVGLAEVEKGRDITGLLTHVLAKETGRPPVLAA
jgi:hypothetical protein